MSTHEFLPGTNTLSPAGIESFRAEIKEVSRQFDLQFIEDEVVKGAESFLENPYAQSTRHTFPCRKINICLLPAEMCIE